MQVTNTLVANKAIDAHTKRRRTFDREIITAGYGER